MVLLYFMSHILVLNIFSKKLYMDVNYILENFDNVYDDITSPFTD